MNPLLPWHGQGWRQMSLPSMLEGPPISSHGFAEARTCRAESPKTDPQAPSAVRPRPFNTSRG